jgi:hypothetical protein
MTQLIVKSKNGKDIKVLIKSAVENELRIIGFGIAKTQRKLEELEKETGMNSKDFYRRFQEGSLGDDIRFIRWAGECETLERLKDDYRHLQELELCS